jgi:tetratricopeptide (TPR) repeat protein
MKVVHNSTKIARSENAIESARSLEKDGQLKEAATYYEQALKENTLDEQAYDRLMIIYRKEKEYKKELNTILAGIKAYEDFYKSNLKTSSKKITDLSRALLRSTGLADKKGNLLYEPEPIARWRKRLGVIQKKLKK